MNCYIHVALTKGLGGGGEGLVNLLDLVWIIMPRSVECNGTCSCKKKKGGIIIEAEPRWSAIVKVV